MKIANELLNKIQSNLPDLASTEQLINVGIFTSVGQAANSRKRGDSPPFITLSRKRILYPKEQLITWLEKRTTLT